MSIEGPKTVAEITQSWQSDLVSEADARRIVAISVAAKQIMLQRYFDIHSTPKG